MGILLVVAAALIKLFDLEEGTDLSTTQRTAGYFVIILICLFMASFVLSFGYIYITVVHCMIINKEQIKFEHIERVRGLLSVRYILCKSEVGHYYNNLWNIMNFCCIIGIGAALGQLGWWSGTVFMGEVGPVLLSSPLQTSGTFYLFAGMCFLAFLHALLLIPETKVINNGLLS